MAVYVLTGVEKRPEPCFYNDGSGASAKPERGEQ